MNTVVAIMLWWGCIIIGALLHTIAYNYHKQHCLKRAQFIYQYEEAMDRYYEHKYDHFNL